MKKFTLTKFTLNLTILILLVNFFLFWSATYGTFFNALKATVFFVAMPLIFPLVFIKQKPTMSLGGVLFYIPLLIFCYYQEYVAPYIGGGARMVYVLTYIFGFPLIVIGMWVLTFLFNFFQIKVIDDEQ